MAKIPSFAPIEARAAKRKGGKEALEALLPQPKTARALMRISDDRWLSAMCQGVFSAGFAWKVVETKWPEFEAVFHGFEPEAVAAMDDGTLDEVSKDPRVIRNRPKIWTIRDNAGFVLDTRADHGSFGKFVARWPADDPVGLHQHLNTRGSRLGGTTGPYLLRRMGKDTFIVSRDVAKALIRAKVVDRPPTGKRAMQAVQDAFNGWAEQTGRPLSQLSRILACSEP